MWYAKTPSSLSSLLRGEQFDSAIGMYYLRARYYVPRTGRFLTADKYETEELGACDCSKRNSQIPSIASRHLFGYGAGDPVNTIDPSGMSLLFTTRSLLLVVRLTLLLPQVQSFGYYASIGCLAVGAYHLVSPPTTTVGQFADYFCALIVAPVGVATTWVNFNRS